MSAKPHHLARRGAVSERRHNSNLSSDLEHIPFYFGSTIRQEGKRYRVLGVAYVAVLAVLLALKGKNYYMLPIYPMLFAGGGVWFEAMLRARRRLGWTKVVYPVLLVVGGAVVAPLAVPILPVETLIRYQQTLGFEPPKTEVGHRGPLPQRRGRGDAQPPLLDGRRALYDPRLSRPEAPFARAVARPQTLELRRPGPTKIIDSRRGRVLMWMTEHNASSTMKSR